MKIYYATKSYNETDDPWCVYWRLETEPAQQKKPLKPRLDLANHSPTGFAWGYGGSGPAQLALAILADVTGDGLLALKHYMNFKFRVIAGLDQDAGWTLSEADIREKMPEIWRPLSRAGRVLWKPVRGMDEYKADGDTYFCQTKHYLYYWNEARKVVRRYGEGGSYAEIPYQQRPETGTGRLANVLSAAFHKRLGKKETANVAAD